MTLFESGLWARLVFDFPWVWLLLPLPLLTWHWLPAFQDQQDKLRVPFSAASHSQSQAAGSGSSQRPRLTALFGQSLIWLLLICAAARPVLLQPPLTQTQPKRDIVLAIDLSQSMSEQDVSGPDGATIERLSAVKQAALDFIEQRPDDRIGLVGFGDQAFPLAPPSAEHESLKQILAITQSGIAGANTALGDAIGVTLKLLENSELPEKVLILLSDGQDNRSRLDPLQAARIAAERQLKIHTIAFGQPVTESGTDSENAADTQTLQAIAERTGGRAFMAADQQALAQVYASIDALTPHTALEFKAQPRRELFWLPTALALSLMALQWLTVIAVPVLRTRKKPTALTP